MGCIHIPDDLVANILSRLPAIVVLHFKCVSKSWNALIDSRYFNRKHFDARNNSTHGLFFSKTICSLYTVRLNDIDKIEVRKHPLEQFPKSTQVLRFCNGLVLLQIPEKNKIIIWNPSTKEHKELPKSLISDRDCSFYLAESYGFCYDSFSKDYKVVVVFMFYDRHEYGPFISFEVCSLKSNSWKFFDKYVIGEIYMSDGDVFVNGALHWLGNECSKRVIVSFDVISEKIKVMSTPNYSSDIYKIQMGEFQGCICLNSYDIDFLHLWLKKDYGVKESWVKLFSISKLFPITSFPLAYSRSGKNIFLTDSGDLVLLHDMTKGTTMLVSHFRSRVPDYATNFLQNLVINRL